MKEITEEKALRYNKDKLKWSLVHFKSIEPLVEVLMYGAKKYTTNDGNGGLISGENNWKKGLNKREILDSMQRHLAALIDEEELDTESKLKHIGHIMCNCMFYEYMNNQEINGK